MGARPNPSYDRKPRPLRTSATNNISGITDWDSVDTAIKGEYEEFKAKLQRGEFKNEEEYRAAVAARVKRLAKNSSAT